MDEWPDSTFHIGQHDHLHALGVIVATYNLLEFSLFTLFNHYAGTAGDIGLKLFTSLPNPRRIEILKAEVDGKEQDAALKAAMLHYLSGYRILESNRNFLAHSHTIMNLPEQPHLTFGKGSRSNPTAWSYAHLGLSQLRTIADEMKAYWLFGSELHAFATARGTGGRLDFGHAGVRVPTIPIHPPIPLEIPTTPTGTP